MKPKIHIRVCSHFREEIATVAGEPEFQDIVGMTYPSFCKHPQNKRGEWQREMGVGVPEKDSIIVLGSCFLGNIREVPGGGRVRFEKLNQCFYLFAGRTLADSYMNQGAYLITPGWLKEWRQEIERWGFDRETAQAFFSESAKKIVLLDTGTNPESQRLLEDFADFVGLPREGIPVGLDYFRMYLRNQISLWREEEHEKELKKVAEEARRKETDYAMAISLLEDLAQKLDEDVIVKGILELFTVLFAPGRLLYIPVCDGVPGSPQPAGSDAEGLASLQSWLASSSDASRWLDDSQGFMLRIVQQGSTLGGIELSGFAFPEYAQKYLNLASSVSGLCSLVIAKARLFQKVNEMANTDALTGFSTRRHFFESAASEIARAVRYSTPLSALMFDIDYFKLVNDTHGHAAGDLVLKAIGERCRQTLRETDVAGRYGGEEFAVILPETDLSQALILAERLRCIVEEMSLEFGGTRLKATISLGIANLSPDCRTLDRLLARCDAAMYEAKAAGRNRSAIAD